jgi:hypothetical protein
MAVQTEKSMAKCNEKVIHDNSNGKIEAEV